LLLCEAGITASFASEKKDLYGGWLPATIKVLHISFYTGASGTEMTI